MDWEVTLSLRNKFKIENEKALGNKDKAAVVSNKELIKKYNTIHKLLKKLIQSPTAAYVLDFHKVHMQYLLIVFMAVKKMEQVTETVAQMQMNVEQYLVLTERVLRHIEEMPSDPLPGLNPMDEMALAADREFAVFHDEIIQDYQQLATDNLRNITHCAVHGYDIYRATAADARHLLELLNATVPASDPEKIVLESNKKVIRDIIYSMDRVQRMSQRAEKAIPTAQQQLEHASNFVKYSDK
ncbi:hypothetical protein ACFO9Q_21910 [Paenibacillus sp. GCM10023252]|uniref:hypothetical protein n=1 Tax=Paenibacillus sp. GCM10023252 TaxID=3252649 RepID=UPI00360C91BF